MKTISVNTRRIKKLIGNFKVGLFNTEGIQSLLLPNGVVSIIQTDDTGSVYFYASCYKKRLAFIDSSFHSSLEFNEKDFERTIRLHGSTEIVANSVISKENGVELILLKMKISKIDFHSNIKSVFEAVPQKISNWLKQFAPTNAPNKASELRYN